MFKSRKLKRQARNIERTPKKRRSLPLILGSALLLGGLYFTLSRDNTNSIMKKSAQVGHVASKSDLEHHLDGQKSANFKGSTAILYDDPLQVLFFRSNSVVKEVVLFKQRRQAENAHMKAFGNTLLVCGDRFLVHIRDGMAYEIDITDIKRLGKSLDCTYKQNEFYAVGSGKSILFRRDSSKKSFGYSTAQILKIEGFSGFVRPSLAAAGNRIFLVSEGMRHLYGISFDSEKIIIDYEPLKKVMGIDQAKSMRAFGIKGKLYLYDGKSRIVYRIDPEKMALLDKFETH
jgi:hypothetical protein